MNELKLSFPETIKRLRKHGWSHREIARELGIDRGTVGRYLRLDAKPATQVPAGSDLANPAIAIPGSAPEAEPKPAKVPVK